MFDTEEERERRFADERLSAGAVDQFAQSRANTPIDGFAKGVAALGSGIGRGFLGVFTEPVKGATEGGAGGFFTGLGRGLVGLVARPAAGVIDLGVKTTEGFANTPSTITSLVRGETTNTLFGSHLKVSLDLAKTNKHRHLIVKCLDELEHNGLDKKHVWDTVASEPLVMKFRDSFNANQDVNLEAIEPVIVAQLFKLYLLELPTPLITQSVFDELMKIAALASSQLASPAKTPVNSEDETVKKIKAHLSTLPEENKAVLSEICIVSRKFLKSASRNGLDLSTLSASLSLCLMRPENFQWNKDAASPLAGLTTFATTNQISQTDRRSIQYLTKLIIMNYQPGYLSFNLYE